MKTFSFIFCIAFVLFSCTENKTSGNIENADDDNFYALTVGNSWVYKNYKLNKDTNAYDLTPVIDSASIVSTEDINGNTYFKFRRLTTGNETKITFCNENGERFEFLRDSLGFLVNEEGKVKFTHTSFDERIFGENDDFNIYEALQEDTEEVTVESGIFSCVFSKRYAVLNANNEFLPGKDFFYYADGFGLIYDTSSFVSSDKPTIIRRLDSYKIIN
ncbi:hypothetical protein H7U19_03900 [Hyunsoonleella sp. SJ7]|uniref:Uncharacterized protein n=1 Tax=Hyunsoonleella aquatilis TaxID=2762758 RepID=A0A923H6X6_9FLAO|nr:hypothetical protein [Hyunsoonleella aquatilis]MBC3757531.1 hypothetical protein [Hyunsoonleella aquatilis]